MRDPDLAAKTTRVLDLYQRTRVGQQRTWGGQRLAADEYVISADEKVRARGIVEPVPSRGR